MKIEIESTTKVVELVLNGQSVLARIWEGKTVSGIRVIAYITRIAAPAEENLTEFEKELELCRIPSADVEAIPLRLIL